MRSENRVWNITIRRRSPRHRPVYHHRGRSCRGNCGETAGREASAAGRQYQSGCTDGVHRRFEHQRTCGVRLQWLPRGCQYRWNSHCRVAPPSGCVATAVVGTVAGRTRAKSDVSVTVAPARRTPVLSRRATDAPGQSPTERRGYPGLQCRRAGRVLTHRRTGPAGRLRRDPHAGA
ncbi:hypothetical protein Hjap01_01487 [Haloarcula japonica]